MARGEADLSRRVMLAADRDWARLLNAFIVAVSAFEDDTDFRVQCSSLDRVYRALNTTGDAEDVIRKASAMIVKTGYGKTVLDLLRGVSILKASTPDPADTLGATGRRKLGV
jgi:hypothetical protein